jgi:hypothetical protein
MRGHFGRETCTQRIHLQLQTGKEKKGEATIDKINLGKHGSPVRSVALKHLAKVDFFCILRGKRRQKRRHNSPANTVVKSLTSGVNTESTASHPAFQRIVVNCVGRYTAQYWHYKITCKNNISSMQPLPRKWWKR